MISVLIQTIKAYDFPPSFLLFTVHYKTRISIFRKGKLLTVILQTHFVFGGYTPGYPWLPITPDSPVRLPPHPKTCLRRQMEDRAQLKTCDTATVLSDVDISNCANNEVNIPLHHCALWLDMANGASAYALGTEME